MDQLDEALAARTRAQQLAQTTRYALQVAIRNGLHNGEMRICLVHKTGYTGKHIRRISREM